MPIFPPPAAELEAAAAEDPTEEEEAPLLPQATRDRDIIAARINARTFFMFNLLLVSLCGGKNYEVFQLHKRIL
jgi:hypothetical protein